MVAAEQEEGILPLAPALPRGGFMFTLLSGKGKTCPGLLRAFTEAARGMGDLSMPAAAQIPAQPSPSPAVSPPAP